MYQIVITEPAEQDVALAARYIAAELQNSVAAGRLLDDIESAVSSLEDMLKRYALVKNEILAGLGFRCLPVHNYLVFYIVREETKSVIIERFLYNRRDWNNIIGK